MCNNVNNSQSTAAVNSAVESNANVVKKAKKIVKAAMKKANESNIIYKSRNDGAGRWYVTAELPTESNNFSYNITVERVEEMMGMSSTWSRITRAGNGDMYVFQNVLLDAVCDCLNETLSKLCSFFQDLNERLEERNNMAEAANNAAEVSEAPSLDEAPSLEQAPVLDEKKILEDFCTNEASKIMYAGLTSVALTNNEEFYMYDYESLYNYLIDAGFDADRAYEIRDQYDEEVDRAIRGLLTAPDFVPVEVSDSDIESTERFWDDITFPYSAKGLAYVRKNTRGVDMADILKEVAEFHWDFESVVKESRWTRFTNNSFMDLIWSTCWAEYLVEHTDEALEAETRYVMDFDSVYDDLFGDLWPYMTSYDDSCGGCELWVDSWYAVERAAEIIEDSVADSDTRRIDWDEFPDYMMAAFLGDLYGFETFTERVMSELEGGDIVDILPYDDGLYLSFVGDEAEIAA
jgi:hypothetical protein